MATGRAVMTQKAPEAAVASAESVPPTWPFADFGAPFAVVAARAMPGLLIQSLMISEQGREQGREQQKQEEQE